MMLPSPAALSSSPLERGGGGVGNRQTGFAVKSDAAAFRGGIFTPRQSAPACVERVSRWGKFVLVQLLFAWYYLS